MKVLNLYSGIGGNRKFWADCEVTAVEIEPKIAEIYQDFFPNDKVIVADAHDYLLKHFKEFDFIWSSPPCPSHSKARFWGFKDKNPIYPDMKLYQEIIFLQNHSKSNWVIENVVPYYKPLIPANRELGRHLFWSNFILLPLYGNSEIFFKDDISMMSEYYNIDISKYKRINKTKLLRNCVNPKLGLHIYNSLLNHKNTYQLAI